ncbi:hypothetical protein MMC08_006301 [Hypocenomyce scalaris]|nr:hypothetical protein [Hypocenomyce scalaris]
MPPLQPGRLGRASLTTTLPKITAIHLSKPSSTSPSPPQSFSTSSPRHLSPAQTRPFSSTPSRSSADSHGSHYDPPSGWLFGVPPGEKYKKEGWENVWVYGFFGSLALAVVAYAYKPDTSIQTWALEEARRRLEAEGILADPEVGKK